MGGGGIMGKVLNRAFARFCAFTVIGASGIVGLSYAAAKTEPSGSGAQAQTWGFCKGPVQYYEGEEPPGSNATSDVFPANPAEKMWRSSGVEGQGDFAFGNREICTPFLQFALTNGYRVYGPALELFVFRSRADAVRWRETYLKHKTFAWTPSGQVAERKEAKPVGSPPTLAKPRLDEKIAATSSFPQRPKGPTPNELKYQRELKEYQARLGEIEKIKADTAAKHASDKAVAERELARHRQETAAAEATNRRYQNELAEHQRKVATLETAKDREQKVDWREAVVVCSLNESDGQSRFGNWRCDGPLQFTYAKLGSAGAAPDARAFTSLSEACGGSREAVRDLGMVGVTRLFGCSFGLHPKSTSGIAMDAAAKHGISFVPGRAVYRCPAWKSGCRTQ